MAEVKAAIVHSWIQTVVTLLGILGGGIALANKFENTQILQGEQLRMIREQQLRDEKQYDEDHPRSEGWRKRGGGRRSESSGPVRQLVPVLRREVPPTVAAREVARRRRELDESRRRVQ